MGRWSLLPSLAVARLRRLLELSRCCIGRAGERAGACGQVSAPRKIVLAIEVMVGGRTKKSPADRRAKAGSR